MNINFLRLPSLISCLFLCCLAACFCWGCKKINYPTNEYPNGQLLVDGDFLESILGTRGLVVIDSRTSGYEAGHIPGAVNLQWKDFVDNDTMLLSVAEISKKLGTAGIRKNKSYVIYDDTVTSRGEAGHFFWLLEYLGCSDVHILNGGWDLWTAENRETETAVNTLDKTIYIPTVKKKLLATKDQIAERLGDEDFAVIDSRADEEFIGWQLYGEARGGTIPGARHLPCKHFFADNKTIIPFNNLQALLYNQGIATDMEVTAYGSSGGGSGFVYFMLRLMGYTNCSNYANSIKEWAADVSQPMRKMQNYQALVYPDWVNKLINGENPPTYSGNGYVILYPSYEPRNSYNRTDYAGTSYETGHIPGAVFVDVYSLENGPNSEYGDGYEFPEEGNIQPIADLQQFLGNLGISKDMTVVVYANDDISMMTAGRAAWALLLAGVDDVRILNGSYAAWVDYGGSIETTPNTPSPVAFGADSGNPQYLATKNDVLAVVNGANTDAVIADDRSWEEYIGESNSYYQYFNELGRIQTADWIGDWTELTREDMQSLKIYTEVEEDWAADGFTADKKMYFYCGTGWRSALYTFYAYVIGWPAANYDGGWFEWSYYDQPRETGDPTK